MSAMAYVISTAPASPLVATISQNLHSQGGGRAGKQVCRAHMHHVYTVRTCTFGGSHARCGMFSR